MSDINTLFLEDHERMDSLEEDQLDEEMMMEEGRDEKKEAVPDEPQPSTSTVNIVTTDHAHSLPTKHSCTHHRNAPDRWSQDRVLETDTLPVLADSVLKCILLFLKMVFGPEDRQNL
ncbi:UNVERIFIED_CONTAM: hypothetical protein FKN15_007495 [Acipenser sinensis]